MSIPLERAQKIRLLIMDVDGVLTDGRIWHDTLGQEFKSFDVKDGHGIVMAHRAKLRTALISGRESESTVRRAKELGIEIVFQKIWNKLEVYEQILRDTQLTPEEVAYVGDDVIDIPLLHRVGLAVAVADAVEEVKAAAHVVTQRAGGQGAVREVIELILRAQGQWGTLMERYTKA
ncbi:MAG: HAD hydrolase family protein [Nitrospinae bacterium]|nr:HAD hydrolase family protein [Nitrospinota bacterium]